MLINKPELCIMIGLPGSGKDTIAKDIQERNENSIILSSDEIRNELFGYENQDNNSEVFKEMNKRCLDALKEGKNVIYNATNLSYKRRKSLIDDMKKYVSAVNGIFCIAPINTIFERNIIRSERHLPEDKLFQMLETMDIPLFYENFDTIHIVNTENRYKKNEMLDWFYNIGEDYDQKNEHHSDTLKNHLLLTAQKFIELTENNNLYDVGRFHDIGKPYSRKWNEDKQKYTYYNHHKISAYLYLLYYIYKNDLNGIKDIPQDALENATLIYHHMDKFVGNLDKTKELLGNDLYKKLEYLMEADAFRGELDLNKIPNNQIEEQDYNSMDGLSGLLGGLVGAMNPDMTNINDISEQENNENEVDENE